MMTGPDPDELLEGLLLAVEEVDSSWYDDEGTVRWHPELWERLVVLRRAHSAYEQAELAQLGGAR